MSDTEQLDTALAILSPNVRREVERLRDIEKWAHAQLNVLSGDHAVIKDGVSIKTDNGWRPWREVLKPGCTGVVGDTYLGSGGGWGCHFTPDVQWTVDDGWKPFAPSVRHLVDRPATFMLRVDWLRKRKAEDMPFEIPADAVSWR